MKKGKSIEHYEDAVSKFKKGRITRRELLKVLANLILIIPPSKGNYDEDQRSEFFAFIMGDIERILRSYQAVEGASFKTWFAKVLSRRYIYFLKRLNSKQEAFIDYEDSSEIDKHYAAPASSPNEEYAADKSILPVFSVGEQNIIQEKYGNENRTQEYVEHILEKSSRKRRIQGRVNFQYYKMMRFQQLQLDTNDSEELAKLKEKEIEIKKRKRIYEKMYNSYNIYPTNNWVAKRLHISPGTVASYLARIRKKILKYYHENDMDFVNL